MSATPERPVHSVSPLRSVTRAPGDPNATRNWSNIAWRSGVVAKAVVVLTVLTVLPVETRSEPVQPAEATTQTTQIAIGRVTRPTS